MESLVDRVFREREGAATKASGKPQEARRAYESASETVFIPLFEIAAYLATFIRVFGKEY